MNETFWKRQKKRLRRGLVALGWCRPILYKVEQGIKVMVPDSGTWDFTVLALQPYRFPYELEAFRKRNVRVVAFPKVWQHKLLELYWDKGIDINRYYPPVADEHTQKVQKRLRCGLATLMSRLKDEYGFDCILSSGLNFLMDYDYAFAAKAIGVPYVIMHRECFSASRKDYDGEIRIARRIGSFFGDFAIFHNETCRGNFVASGVFPEDKTASLGCMRMDDFLKRIQAHVPTPGRRKQVLLFSFTHACNLQVAFWDDPKGGYKELFRSMHGRLAEMAARHPEVDFLIKPKWGGEWFDYIQDAIQRRGLNPKAIPNLKVVLDINPHDAILESDVILAHASTTMAEAAIAGKPVIIPHYAECLDEDIRDNILLLDYQNGFDVARSEDDMERLILHRLEHPEISEESMEIRRDIFERFVSCVDATASEKHVDKIAEIIKNHQQDTPAPSGA